MDRKPIRTYQRKLYPSQLILPNLRRMSFSSDSDDDYFIHLQTKNTSSDHNPFESTFDRVAKDIKLPSPLPPRQSTRISSITSSDDEAPLMTYTRPLSNTRQRGEAQKKTTKNAGRKSSTSAKVQPPNKKQRLSHENMTCSPLFKNVTKRLIKKRRMTSNLMSDSILNPRRNSVKGELKACTIPLRRLENDPPIENQNDDSDISIENIENMAVKSLASEASKNVSECSVDLTRMSFEQVSMKKKDETIPILDNHAIMKKFKKLRLSKSRMSRKSSDEHLVLKTPLKYRFPKIKITKKSFKLDKSRRTFFSSPPIKDVKSCIIEITRLEDVKDCQSQNYLNGNETSQELSINEKEPNEIQNTKDCQVILSRMNCEYKANLLTQQNNNLISSTPRGKMNTFESLFKCSPIAKKEFQVGKCASPITIESAAEDSQEVHNSSSEILVMLPRRQLKTNISSSHEPKKLLSDSTSNFTSFDIGPEATPPLVSDDSNEVIPDTFADTTKVNSFAWKAPKKSALNKLEHLNTQRFSRTNSSPSLLDDSTTEKFNSISMAKVNNASSTGGLENTADSICITSTEITSQSNFSNELVESTNTDIITTISTDNCNPSEIIDSSKNDLSSITSEDKKEIESSFRESTNTNSIVTISSESDNTSEMTDMSHNVLSANTTEPPFQRLDSTNNNISSANEKSSQRLTTQSDDNIRLTMSLSPSTNASHEANEDVSSIYSTNEILDPASLPQVRVALTRLQNSVTICKPYPLRSRSTRVNFSSPPLPRTKTSLPEKNSFSNTSTSNLDIKSVVSKNPILHNIDKSTNGALMEEYEHKFVYLKPGKSWARSLSILNHIRNNDDIELYSSGKGRKWRQSVRNILDMQSHGQRLSCVNNPHHNQNEDTFNGARGNVTARAPFSRATIANSQTASPGRFVRRVSIRVLPDSKRSTISTQETNDTSFLQIYGIPTSKDREKIAQKSVSIAPTDVSIYNLRRSNAGIEAIIPSPVASPHLAVLQRCGQADFLPFEHFYSELFLDSCRKIGEGVYGEVFLYETDTEKSVIKLIPIEGDALVNGEPQKKFSEILSEIIISKELHNLRFHNTYYTNGFVEVKNVRCIKGKYPQKLIDLWQAYDEEKKSDNDCPTLFKEDQLYIALELGHGGQDLEAFIFQNATEAYTLFLQAALTLAVAENSLDFEHRDLHWGNILISRTEETETSYGFENEKITLPCKGIKVAIIDFTFSRMSYQGCCMFNDLALDPDLFTAVGEYQFDIYRLMKDKVGNNWHLFEPYTNILWLHYVLDKMINMVRYKKTTTKIHKFTIQKLQELKEIILEYDSAFDFISKCKKLTGLQRT